MSLPASTRGILFYDGECGLCTRSVRFFLSIDKAGHLAFAPLQGKTAAAKLPSERLPTAGHGSSALSTVVYLPCAAEDRGAQVPLVRSDAVARALIDVGGFWRWTGKLLLGIPFCLRDGGYRCVARNRFKLFGKSACTLPSATVSARLLD